MNPQTGWPTPGEEQQLLTHLNTGTPTAHEEVAARFLPLLMRFLLFACPRATPDLRDEAADRALLDFLDAPHRFDPARATLGAYLRMAARHDLLNLLEAERRARRGIALDSIAEPADYRNMMRDEEITWEHPRLAAELGALDADERAAFELMRDGVRETAAFVSGLGLGHLSAAEQTVAVKRVKDRVKKRLARAVEDLR